MPLLSDYRELSLVGLEIDEVGWKGTRLRAEFGGGYGAFALPLGNSGGLHRWTLSSGALPDDDAYQNLIEGVPRFQYYFDFFKDHTEGDEEIFMIEFRGKYYHAAFAEPEISAGMETIDLFTMDGVEIIQRKVSGILYDTDGSILFPWMEFDSNDLVTVHELADGNEVPLWYDHNRDDHNDFSGTSTPPHEPTLQTNEVNGLPVARFDGANDDLSLGPNNDATLYDIFFVLKVRASTFANDCGILSDPTDDDILVGDSGTTKFQDLSLTNYEYRKDGVLYADNNQQAPMNEYGVIHLRFADGITFGGSIIAIGVALAGAGTNAAIDLAKIIGYDAALTARQFENLTNGLMDRYDITA